MGILGSTGALCEICMVDSAGDINLVHCASVWADLSLEQLHSNSLAFLQVMPYLLD